MVAEFLPDAALEDLGIVQVVYEIAASCNRGIVSENSEMQDLKNDRIGIFQTVCQDPLTGAVCY